MSEDEKQAIEEFKELHYGDYFCDVILNLIDKQQKEIEKFKKHFEMATRIIEECADEVEKDTLKIVNYRNKNILKD